MRVLVKIVPQFRYELVPEESKALIFADATRRTSWLCMKCAAFTTADVLYATVDPRCSVHGHVIPKEVTA